MVPGVVGKVFGVIFCAGSKNGIIFVFLCSIVYTSFLHSDCARFIVNQCNKQHRGRWTNVLGVDRRAPHS